MPFFAFEDFWLDHPETILIWAGQPTLTTLRTLVDAPRLTTAMPAPYAALALPVPEPERDSKEPEWDSNDAPEISYDTVGRLSDLSRRLLFKDRHVNAIRRLGDAHLAIDWTRSKEEATPLDLIHGMGPRMDVVETFPPALGDELIGFRLHRADDSTYGRLVLNGLHPLVQWAGRAAQACVAGQHGLSRQAGAALHDRLATPVGYGGHESERLIEYLREWRRMEGLPEDLKPPEVQLTNSHFLAVSLVDLFEMTPLGKPPGGRSK